MQSIIYDIVPIEADAALRYGASGCVVMAHLNIAEVAPAEGDLVLLIRADGWSFTATAIDIRAEEKSFALFLKGVSVEQVPIGTPLQWGSEISAAARLLRLPAAVA